MNSTYCNNCGVSLDEPPDLDSRLRTPCPQCGSTSRRGEDSVHLQAKARASVHLVHRRKYAKRPLAEMFSGWEIRRSVGDYVSKEQVFDRENDRYRERVVTEDGLILRDVDEPLSQHRGYGSAKFKKRPT